MAFLLDTCTISELVAKRPDRHAVEQVEQLPRESIFLSVVVLAELQSGIEQMAPSARRIFLEKWLHEHVLPLYADRTFPIDTPIARRWGLMDADLCERGLTMQTVDGFIAATALEHGMTVVTRNEADFAPS